MKNLTIFSIVLILVISYICSHLYRENRTLKQNVEQLSNHMVSSHSNQDSLQVVVDSLLPITWNVARYEIALDRLKEKDPKAYKLFEECLLTVE